MYKFISFGSIILIISLFLSGCGTMSQADQQKTLKSFTSQIQNDQLPVSNAVTNIGVAISLFNGSDTSNISTAVSVLKDRSETAINDFSTMSPPSGFSSDVSDILTGAVSNYMLASDAESSAADTLQHYLDSQDPKDLQTFKNKMAKAKEDISQANSYLSQAKQDVGMK